MATITTDDQLATEIGKQAVGQAMFLKLKPSHKLKLQEQYNLLRVHYLTPTHLHQQH